MIQFCKLWYNDLAGVCVHPFSIMESIFSADHSLTEHARRMNSLCRLCGERVKRGEKDKNRRKRTRCTHYYDEILPIFWIDIVEDTDHKHSSAINHQLPEKTCFGTEEQGGAAQSVNLVKEHAHDTSLPQADAIFNEKQNVTVCFACCKLGAHMIMTNFWMYFKTWMSV